MNHWDFVEMIASQAHDMSALQSLLGTQRQNESGAGLPTGETEQVSLGLDEDLEEELRWVQTQRRRTG